MKKISVFEILNLQAGSYAKLCKFRQTPLNVVAKEKDDSQTLSEKVGCLLEMLELCWEIQIKIWNKSKSLFWPEIPLFLQKVGPSCLLKRLELCSQLHQSHYFHRLQIILTTVSFTSYWSLYLFWTETNSPLNIPSAKRLDSWRSLMWCYLKFDLSKGVKGGS